MAAALRALALVSRAGLVPPPGEKVVGRVADADVAGDGFGGATARLGEVLLGPVVEAEATADEARASGMVLPVLMELPLDTLCIMGRAGCCGGGLVMVMAAMELGRFCICCRGTVAAYDVAAGTPGDDLLEWMVGLACTG